MTSHGTNVEKAPWDKWSGPPVRRLGAIGDIHGAAAELEVAIKTFRAMEVDLIVAVGDIVDGPGDVGRCIDILHREDVLTVLGNHERWFLEGTMRSVPHATMDLNPGQRAFLASRTQTAHIPTEAGVLLLCHGVGAEDLAELRPTTRGYGLQGTLDAVRSRPDLYRPDVFGSLGGHTHERMVRHIPPLWFFNAGTLLPDPVSGFLLLDFETRVAEMFDLDKDQSPSLRESVPFPAS